MKVEEEKEAAGEWYPDPPATGHGDCLHCSQVLERQYSRTKALALPDRFPIDEQLTAYKAFALSACERVRDLTDKLIAIAAHRGVEGPHL